MDNRNNNNNAAAVATEAALYDANISITALRQQLFVSKAATLRALQLAEARADEAELQYATEIALREQVRQLRVEIREAEARRMPPAPRPQHARLVGPVSEGSSTTMRDENLALRAENQALHEQLFVTMRARERTHVEFTFGAGHIMGTTIMGTDPATSVADGFGRSHDVANMWIVGSSVFPTGGTANPTLTLAALALRTEVALRAALPGLPAAT